MRFAFKASLAAAFLSIGTLAARAEERQREVAGALKYFSLAQEASRFDPQVLQFEQDLSYEHRTKSDHSLSLYSGTTQLNINVNEYFQFTPIFANTSYEDSRSRDSLQWDGSGGQFIWSILDPDKDVVGFGVYHQTVANSESLATDTRLIVQKTFRGWNLDYNLKFLTGLDGLDGGGVKTTGTLGHVFAVAHGWDFKDMGMTEVSIGAELDVDSAYREWRSYDATTVLAGPTFAVAFERHWSFTLTGLAQLTDEDSPRWQVILAIMYAF